MNDMPLDIKVAQEISSLSSPFNMDEAHILHSKIIAECAAVERWLFNQISPYQKPAMMLSQKIDQMEQLLDQEKPSFNNAKKLKKRLSAFKPFAQFRSEIVHSEMSWATLGSEIVILFENASQLDNPMLRKTTIISISNLRNIRTAIASAENELTMLDARPTPPSSSSKEKPVETTVTPAKAGA